MATNKSTIEALKRMAILIENLKENSDIVRELKIWNKLFKRHIGEQKSQKGQFPDDTYKCDLETNKLKRFRKEELITEY